VNMLLEAGVDPVSPKTRPDHEGRALGGEKLTIGETAVEYVCKQGHTDTLMVMIQYLQPETLEEVLCESCRCGKIENVRAVLENSDVSPNSMFTSATALYLACQAPSLHCVEILLARGADVNLVSTWKPKFTGLNFCDTERQNETALHALVRGRGKNSNHTALQAILRLLAEAGADLDAKDSFNETALHARIHRRPFQATVKPLLEAGADISAVDRFGDTVLHRLLQEDRDVDFMRLLLDHGADLNSRGQHGDTPLHIIFRAESINHISTLEPRYSIDEAAEFHLGKGADCNIKDDNGETVLEEATGSQCSPERFRILLKSCSEENTLKRCLFLVSRRQKYEEKVQIIQAIISAGISIETRDETGKTALLHSYQSKETIKAFLQCGARLDAVDSNGWGLLEH